SPASPAANPGGGPPEAAPQRESWRPAPPAQPVGQIEGYLGARSALVALPAPPAVQDLLAFGGTPAFQQKLAAEAQANGMTPQQAVDAASKQVPPEWTPPSATPQSPQLEKRSEAPTQQQTAQAEPMVMHLPGGGRVELHGVSPEIARSLSETAQ